MYDGTPTQTSKLVFKLQIFTIKDFFLLFPSTEAIDLGRDSTDGNIVELAQYNVNGTGQNYRLDARLEPVTLQTAHARHRRSDRLSRVTV